MDPPLATTAHPRAAANMPCAAHAVFVAACSACRADRTVEASVLALGPRTNAQIAALMTAAACTELPATLSKLSDGTVAHKVHQLAAHIAASNARAIAVHDLPAPPAIQSLLLKRISRDAFISRRVAQIGPGTVCAQTPLGMHDAATLVAKVRDGRCRGTPLTDIVAEYTEAYVDANDAVEKGLFFTDRVCVWHRDSVYKKVPGALEAWAAKPS